MKTIQNRHSAIPLKLSQGLAFVVLGAVSFSISKPVDLQMGARGLGMGGAFTAIADDASAAYWNPAGLASVKDLTLSETHWMMPEVTATRVNLLSAIVPTEMGTVAGSWQMQYAELESGTGSTADETTWREHNFSLSGSRLLWDELLFFKQTSIGVNLNRYVLSAGSQTGAGTGFDLGFKTALPWGFQLGVMARSLGADMMGDKVEPEWRVGLAYQWTHPQHAFSLAFDAANKEDVEYNDGFEGVDVNWKLFSGLEYAFRGEGWFVALRGGGNALVQNSRDVGEVSGGLGLGWNGIHFQYAYSHPLAGDLSLGRNHRLTLDLQLMRLFGKKENAAPISQKQSRPTTKGSEPDDLPMRQ